MIDLLKWLIISWVDWFSWMIDAFLRLLNCLNGGFFPEMIDALLNAWFAKWLRLSWLIDLLRWLMLSWDDWFALTSDAFVRWLICLNDWSFPVMIDFLNYWCFPEMIDVLKWLMISWDDWFAEMIHAFLRWLICLNDWWFPERIDLLKWLMLSWNNWFA